MPYIRIDRNKPWHNVVDNGKQSVCGSIWIGNGDPRLEWAEQIEPEERRCNICRSHEQAERRKAGMG